MRPGNAEYVGGLIHTARMGLIRSDELDIDAFLDQLDTRLPDDYFVINGADRERDGRFSVWYKRTFYADGKKKVPAELQKHFASVIGTLAEDAASETPREAIRAVRAIREYLEMLEYELAARARGCGWSWREVALDFGISASAAHRRFGQLEFEPRARRPPESR